MNSATMKERFLQALPLVIQSDAKLYALAEAVAGALAQRWEEPDAIRIYPEIGSLPEELLDILAEDYKVDWYNYNYPLAAKRAIIASQWYVHRHMGTTEAVRRAIRAVYAMSDVEEWWQDCYDGGEPYHFRILLEASSPIVPVTNTDILREVELYRSYRSVLDGVAYRSTVGIVIESGRNWQNYYGRVAGTYPVRRLHGGWDHGEIVVETAAGSAGRTAPETGSLPAGTWPEPARQGRLSHEDLTVETARGGQVYTDPDTGRLRSGVFPEPAVQGIRTADTALVETAGGRAVYENPAAGETPAGTFPEAAVQGTRESNGLIAATDGQGVPYAAPVCGVPKLYS